MFIPSNHTAKSLQPAAFACTASNNDTSWDITTTKKICAKGITPLLQTTIELVTSALQAGAASEFVIATELGPKFVMTASAGDSIEPQASVLGFLAPR